MNVSKCEEGLNSWLADEMIYIAISEMQCMADFMVGAEYIFR
jgi:hypothetical protein